MSSLRRIVILLVAIVVTIAIGAFVFLQRGISARSQPSSIETTVARTLRHFSIPRGLRNRPDPIQPTPRALAEARAHWADHCAVCHSNDGSGKTEMGRNLYPRAPDMRLPDTQKLTDGELFAIIRDGVRLSGMPAWGDAAGHSDADNWKLVLFIRHLPKITPEEISEMERLNPKSPAAMQEMREEEEFLHGH